MFLNVMLLFLKKLNVLELCSFLNFLNSKKIQNRQSYQLPNQTNKHNHMPKTMDMFLKRTKFYLGRVFIPYSSLSSSTHHPLRPANYIQQ